MTPRDLSLLIFSAGLVVAASLGRKALTGQSQQETPVIDDPRSRRYPDRFTVEHDVPWLDLRRGEQCRIEPEALIRIGDVVALYSDQGEVTLTRFHDELMGCVAGLVVRETPQLSAA